MIVSLQGLFYSTLLYLKFFTLFINKQNHLLNHSERSHNQRHTEAAPTEQCLPSMCPSCVHTITSSQGINSLSLNWEDFFTLVPKHSHECESLFGDFIHSKMRMQPHMLRGGAEDINPRISLKRHSMDPTISRFAFRYVTSWLFWASGLCSTYQHTYTDWAGLAPEKHVEDRCPPQY